MSESVIVAHGLWMPGLETKLVRRRLEQAGFRPSLFRFPTLRGTLAQNAQALARLAAKSPGDRVHFVGYSLGGVITLEMLDRHRLVRVGRIVCLGSPLRGSRAAEVFRPYRFGRAFIGKSLTEHIEHGGMARWAQPYELGIIAGNRPLGMGRMVQDFPGENDGTVAVDETRLPGATAHITLPVTHTQMLIDATVARQTIHFLRHGRFA